MSFVGKLAEHSVGQYNIQKAFITANGVTLREGIMDSNETEAIFKRRLIEEAKAVTLLIDYTKFNMIAHETVCPVNKITRIFTDDKADPVVLKQYTDIGIEVVVVSAQQPD